MKVPHHAGFEPRTHGDDSERIKTDCWPATCKGRRVSFNTNIGRVNSAY